MLSRHLALKRKKLKVGLTDNEIFNFNYYLLDGA